jgi:hypothetical protein
MVEEMKHTNGPWRVAKCRCGSDFCNAYFIDPWVVSPTGIAGIDDARLIAAAPDLLEALALYIADCELEGLGYNTDTYREAKAAIAKATGANQ